MAFSESWIETDPDGGVITGSLLDDYQRQAKRALRERLEGDPAAPLTGIFEVGSFAAAPIPRAGTARAHAVATAGLAALTLQDGRLAIDTTLGLLYHLKGSGMVGFNYLPLAGGTVSGITSFSNSVGFTSTVQIINGQALYWTDFGATPRRVISVSAGDIAFFGQIDAGWGAGVQLSARGASLAFYNEGILSGYFASDHSLNISGFSQAGTQTARFQNTFAARPSVAAGVGLDIGVSAGVSIIESFNVGVAVAPLQINGNPIVLNNVVSVASHITLTTNASYLKGKKTTGGAAVVNLFSLTSDANNITRFIAGVDVGGFQWTNQSEVDGWMTLNASTLLLQGATTSMTLNLDTKTGAVTDFSRLTFSRGAIAKWHLGNNLDSSNVDTFGLYNGANQRLLMNQTDTFLYKGVAGASFFLIDTVTGAAADSSRVEFMRGGVVKWQIGLNLDALNSDNFNLLQGSTKVLTIDNLGGMIAFQPSGGAGGFAGMSFYSTRDTSADSAKISLGRPSQSKYELGVNLDALNNNNFNIFRGATTLVTYDHSVTRWYFQNSVRLGGSAAALIGFYGNNGVAQQTIVGSRGGNAALADLLTKMALTGFIVDTTT